MARFGSLVTAMVTPFAPDGTLDTDAAAELARWLVSKGTEGLLLSGTTGEGPTLTDEEKVRLWRAVRDAVDVPLLAGATNNDTATSKAMAAEAEAVGMDGVLVVTPYYNRPSQAAMASHVVDIAGVTDLPIVLYDIPIRTGRKMSSETILGLAEEVPQVVGLKDAAGNPAETARLIANAPADFEVWSGDDSLTLPLLSVGAVGTISVAAHWTAGLFSQMLAAFTGGRLEEARAINASLFGSFAFEGSDESPSPAPTKVMLGLLGHPVGRCRPPMDSVPEGLVDLAAAVADGLALDHSRVVDDEVAEVLRFSSIDNRSPTRVPHDQERFAEDHTGAGSEPSP